MARPTTEQKLREIHTEFLTEFDRIQSAERDGRIQSRGDRRFVGIAGAPWEGPLGDQYANKPRMEFNEVALSVLRIENEYRNNRITVDFVPADGSESDELAEALDGMYRAEYQGCSGDEAVDNAFREGIAGGYGAWRIRAEYEDEDDEDDEGDDRPQRCVFDPIYDADGAVFFDLDAKRQDKADARLCYVLTPMTPQAYRAEYDDDPASWPVEVQAWDFDWCTPDIVWVAEGYRVEYEKIRVQHWRNELLPDEPIRKVTDEEIEAQPELAQVLTATGYRLVRETKRKIRRVHKYIMSGARILEDCGFIAGKCIPVVPYYGRREIIDGVERVMGQVRFAKDAQRLKNMLMSWLAEFSARFDQEKPILTPEQIAGHAYMWAEDNVKKFPYLLINPVTGPDGGENPMGPVGYTKAPSVPPVMAGLFQLANEALTTLLGNQQAGEQLQPNLSGKAVELIQNRLDMQVFIYMSNLAKAVKRCGEIWLSIKKDTAREESRKVKTLTEDGTVSQVVINEPSIDPKTGEQILSLDMGRASKYSVMVDVGPSSSSKRAATVRALTGLASITDDPQIKRALTLATLANVEGEGLADLHAYARRLGIRDGVIRPTEEEMAELQAEMQGQQPDAQTQFLMAEAEKAKANTGLALANTEKARAQTAETLAGIETSQRQQAIEAVRTMAEIQRTDQQAAQ